MRKCNICENNLHYPFMANYERGRFVCHHCLEQRKELVKKETDSWRSGKELEINIKKNKCLTNS